MGTRIATVEDVPALVQIFKENLQHDGDGPTGDDELRSRLAAWFADRNGALLVVAERSGHIVGYATLLPHFPAGDGQPSYFVKGVFVAASARGKGVGRALLRRCAEEAVSRGACHLDITVDADNHGAVSFYLEMGGTVSHKHYLRWDAEEMKLLAEGG